jgi:HTH-like domain
VPGCGRARCDELLAERIQRLIERHPTFGYRRLWALLRFGEGLRVNRKAAYRILKLKSCVRYTMTVWLNLIAIPEEGRRLKG